MKNSNPIDLKKIVESHGWVHLHPWTWDGSILSRIEMIDGSTYRVSVLQGDNGDINIKTSPSVDSHIRKLISQRVSRWLSTEWDSSEFIGVAKKNDPLIASFVENGGGRMLRGSNFFEDLVKTICTINTTWGQTKNMIKNLHDSFGGISPSPMEVIRFGESGLMENCKFGFRAETVLSVTKAMLRDGFILQDGTEGVEHITYDYLISLRGIGPYSAAHCMVMLHDFSRLPIDSEVTSYLTKKGLKDEKEFSNYFDSWGDYKYLGYKLGRIVENTNWIGGEC